MRATAALWMAMAGLAACGCVSPQDPWAHAHALEVSQKRYTEAIRWGNLEQAARYVDPEQRDAFLSLAGPFENVHITDVEIGELDLDEERFEHAEVSVTYRGYALPHYVEKRVAEQQVWYREEGIHNEWRVRPQLAAILAGIGG